MLEHKLVVVKALIVNTYHKLGNVFVKLVINLLIILRLLIMYQSIVPKLFMKDAPLIK